MSIKALAGFGCTASLASFMYFTQFTNNKNNASSSKRRAIQQGSKDISLMNLEERFAYFASIGDGKFMSPEDFFESLVVNSAAQASSASSSKKSTISTLSPSAKNLFNTFDDDNDGTLSYAEYCTLFTLLANSEKNFKTAFHMFDRDGNKCVDAAEFKRILSALSCDPSVKLAFKGKVMDHFFGEKRDKSLPFATFNNMVQNIRHEVRATEFATVDPNNSGKISLGDLRKLVFKHSEEKQAAQPGDEQVVVTRTTYQTLGELLLQERTITRAMEIYMDAVPEAKEKGLNKSEFQRAVACAGAVPISNAEGDIFFKLFDTDSSGSVDAEEFGEVARLRTSFYASHVPDFTKPERNAVQAFAHCMQQRN